MRTSATSAAVTATPLLAFADVVVTQLTATNTFVANGEMLRSNDMRRTARRLA
jgi:hypothetical protein